MDCDLLFPGRGARRLPSANVELARAAGARLVFDVVETREQLDAAVVEHARSLRRQGRRPYAVPRGGATPIGALGYACAARELAEQCEQAEIAPRTVVVATGSGGTQAGLVAGQVGIRPSVAARRRQREQAGSRHGRADPPASRVPVPPPSALTTRAADDVDVRDCRGAGFGVASAEDRVSTRLALHHEGLLLDDYYGAKAMTLFRTLLAAGAPTPGRVLAHRGSGRGTHRHW